MKKTCFKCNEEKPISEFYKQKGMADGHLNKCKECTKKDALEHRWNNIEKIRKYDRERGCRQTQEYFKEYRSKYPNKYKATNMVNNAIRDGKLFKEPCDVCGTMEKVEAHHDDYAKPLNVRWLCSSHHRQWHRDSGEGKNAT